MPIPVVSTSAQYGAIILSVPFNGSEAGVKALKEFVRLTIPLVPT